MNNSKVRKIVIASLSFAVLCAIVLVSLFTAPSFTMDIFAEDAVGTMSDYSVIVVNEDFHKTAEEQADSYIQEFVKMKTIDEKITEGRTAVGDELFISYKGFIDGKEMASASSAGRAYTVGSNAYIDGFDAAITNVAIGDTVSVTLDFPENYGSMSLKGKTCRFEIFVQYKITEQTIEFDNAFANSYSEEYLGIHFDSASEMRDYMVNALEEEIYSNLVFKALDEKLEVESYSESEYETVNAYVANYLGINASNAGMSGDEYAQRCGYENASEFINENTFLLLREEMIIDCISADYGIEFSDEFIDEQLSSYMKQIQAEGSLAEFKSNSDQAWLHLFNKVFAKKSTIANAVRENVEVIENDQE